MDSQDEFRHSSYLFHDRENNCPMQFSMRPCDEREKLKPVIKHGGGTITFKSTKDTIRLAVPGCKVYTDNCVSSKWIWDSVKANKRLPIENYVVKQDDEISVVSDIDEGDNVLKVGAKQRSPKAKRREYLLAHDLAIINYIVTHHCIREIKARSMWQQMERANVVKGRSWQSLKERFRKQIITNLNTYDLPKAKMNYLKEKGDLDLPGPSAPVGSSSSTCSDTSSIRRQFYLPDEDLKIIHYVLDKDEYDAISGNVYWQQVERENILNRTWQSMRDRFLKHIVHNLKKYKIASKYGKRLANLCDCFALDYVAPTDVSSDDNGEEAVDVPKSTKNKSNNDNDQRSRTVDVESPVFELRLEESDESLDRSRPKANESTNPKDDSRESIEAGRKDLVVMDYVAGTNGSPRLQISLFTSTKDTFSTIRPDAELNAILSKCVKSNEDEIDCQTSSDDDEESAFCEQQFVKTVNDLIIRNFAGKTGTEGLNNENEDLHVEVSPTRTTDRTYGKRKRATNVTTPRQSKRLNANEKKAQNPREKIMQKMKLRERLPVTSKKSRND